MENNKKSKSSLVIIILAIIACIFILVIVVAGIVMIMNKDGHITEKIESIEVLPSANTKIATDKSKSDFLDLPIEEKNYFKPPVIDSTTNFNPFQSLKIMDVYARNTPKSFLGAVHFAYGKYEVNTTEFREVFDLLNPDQIKDLYFIVEGHTDSTSDWQFNKTLSVNRANSVKAMLIHLYGIDESHIKTAGYSWDRLAVKPEKKPEDFAANRRTEISCFIYE